MKLISFGSIKNWFDFMVSIDLKLVDKIITNVISKQFQNEALLIKYV